MKAWITKYAMTSGLIEVSGEVDKNRPNEFHAQGWQTFIGEGVQWHRTKAGAIVKAEQMRKSRLTYLRNAFLNVEAMKFE